MAPAPIIAMLAMRSGLAMFTSPYPAMPYLIFDASRPPSHERLIWRRSQLAPEQVGSLRMGDFMWDWF